MRQRQVIRPPAFAPSPAARTAAPACTTRMVQRARGETLTVSRASDPARTLEVSETLVTVAEELPANASAASTAPSPTPRRTRFTPTLLWPSGESDRRPAGGQARAGSEP
jgi:hypothetical protein